MIAFLLLCSKAIYKIKEKIAKTNKTIESFEIVTLCFWYNVDCEK